MKNNSVMVPEAKEAMEQFKMQAASEVGVNLKQGYNGPSGWLCGRPDGQEDDRELREGPEVSNGLHKERSAGDAAERSFSVRGCLLSGSPPEFSGPR